MIASQSRLLLLRSSSMTVRTRQSVLIHQSRAISRDLLLQTSPHNECFPLIRYNSNQNHLVQSPSGLITAANHRSFFFAKKQSPPSTENGSSEIKSSEEQQDPSSTSSTSSDGSFYGMFNRTKDYVVGGVYDNMNSVVSYLNSIGIEKMAQDSQKELMNTLKATTTTPTDSSGATAATTTTNVSASGDGSAQEQVSIEKGLLLNEHDVSVSNMQVQQDTTTESIASSQQKVDQTATSTTDANHMTTDASSANANKTFVSQLSSEGKNFYQLIVSSMDEMNQKDHPINSMNVELSGVKKLLAWTPYFSTVEWLFKCVVFQSLNLVMKILLYSNAVSMEQKEIILKDVSGIVVKNALDPMSLGYDLLMYVSKLANLEESHSQALQNLLPLLPHVKTAFNWFRKKKA